MKKNIVITAGGTSEYIDKVRKITNSGTGKLGSIIANTLGSRTDIDTIYYICTPKSVKPNIGIILQNNINIKIIEIITTNELKNSVEKILREKNIDWFVHSMAVSDYYVDYVSTASLLAQEIEINKEKNIEDILKNAKNKLNNNDKISSDEDNLLIVLKQTPKIIKMIKELSPNTHLIGFKLLENVDRQYLFKIAKSLMKKNNCDYVIANDLKDIKNGQHKAFLIDNNSNKEINGKKEIANEINMLL